MKQVEISAEAPEDKSGIRITIESLDGEPLTPQNIKDAIAEYLLIDPKGLFESVDW